MHSMTTARRVKVGANDPCPCGRIRKYKKCCRGLADWETIQTGTVSDVAPYLSTRGKNLLFLRLVAEALQLDQIGTPREWVEFKRAFTPTAVRRIFEAIPVVWPSGDDLKRALKGEASSTSGLYVGLYEPRVVLTGVTRHSLYADRILLVDPLMYPAHVRDEYNPLLHPEMHRSTALRWISMWFSLMPWIDAGLVGFVRTPGDFYPDLEFESFRRTDERFRQHPELEQLRRSELTREEADQAFATYKSQMTLGIPDDAIRGRAKRDHPEWSPEQVENIVAYVQKLRDRDPYFIEPLAVDGSKSEMLQVSTGANYEMAKLVALHSRSFVMTDMRTRWKEIELDRQSAGIDAAAWSPFAKAFHNLTFSYLNNVPLAAALTLRQEGRLEGLRSCLRKVWDDTAGAAPFDERNVASLTARLEEEVRQAEAEWKRIDGELLKWFGSEAATAVAAVGPAIAVGGAEWLGAAVVVAAVANLVGAKQKRTEHQLRYPAGFFLKLREAAKATA